MPVSVSNDDGRVFVELEKFPDSETVGLSRAVRSAVSEVSAEFSVVRTVGKYNSNCNSFDFISTGKPT